MVLLYNNDAFIKRLNDYKEDQVIKTRILDTNDIIVDEYFEVKTHSGELIGLKNALKQQKELCTALAAKAESKSSDIAADKMKEPKEGPAAARNAACLSTFMTTARWVMCLSAIRPRRSHRRFESGDHGTSHGSSSSAAGRDRRACRRIGAISQSQTPQSCESF